MKSSIIDSIKSLPPLSKTITDVNIIYSSEDSSLADMAKAVASDPMIVANILKAANSPLYGFGKEIQSVAQAVSLFGMSMTRSIVVGNSVKKLLNVDMQPYGITSERFAEICSQQAALMLSWYKRVDKQKAAKLYLAAFLQETGKIIIASDIIQEDETTSFFSEVEMTNNIAQVEKAYVDVTSSEVTAKVFEHWGFDSEFIDIIKYADNPHAAPRGIQEYCIALNIIKTVIPINKPLSEISINYGLKKASDAGYDHRLLEDAIDEMLDAQEQGNT
ncbi:MAG: HDOD domain-containing protein [Campylobacterales bacterium]|nr:HDOD domain-containing protein [Campylobacterales bacterium]